MTTELQPVLRQVDYDSFDFDRAAAYLAVIAKAIDRPRSLKSKLT